METIQKWDNFIYAPLKNPRQIRLIHIHASKEFNDPVHISFSITDLAQPDYYNTLSYTWGETFADGSHLTEVIFCKERQLYVTSNLSDFLRRLRVEINFRASNVFARMPIWIDALSINQEDEFERGQQVAIMSKIYESSFQLIIWLGEFELPDCSEWPFAYTWPASVGDSLSKFENAEKSVIVRIVLLPWFQRRWIIQEVLFTRTRSIWVGEKKLPWRNFIAALERAQLSQPRAALALVNAASPHKEKGLGTWSPSPLLKSLRLWDHSACGDPRDRIYALLNISENTRRFEVDYSSDIETSYYQIAKTIIENGEDLEPISLLVSAISRSRKDTVSILPSWVPDWRNPVRSTTPQEEERLRACFSLNRPTTNKDPKLRAVVRNQYLYLIGWLFPSCRCPSTKSISKAPCECCYPKEPRRQNANCQCTRCATAWLNKYPTFHKEWKEPPVPAGHILCFLEGSCIAFTVTYHPQEATSDQRICQLVTCLPLQRCFHTALNVIPSGTPDAPKLPHPNLYGVYGDIRARFGEAKEIIVA